MPLSIHVHILVHLLFQRLCSNNNISHPIVSCRSKKASLVPFDGNSSSPVVIITNSGVHHALGSSEYPVRVKQCQLAVDMVRQFYSELLEQDEGSIVPNPNHADIKRVKKPSAIKSLRDVSLEMLETVHKAKPTSNSADGVCCRDGESRGSNSTADASGRCPSGDGITTTPSKLSTKPQPSTSYMPSVAYRRARHVITENIRTLDSVQALSDHDWARLGQNMTESHASLSADYEVSCGEIDLLVDLALSVPGVYGSRITGGGFGGCTVTLVERQAVATFKAHVKSKYKEATGIDCVCYEVLPSAGTGVIPQTTTAALAAGSSNSVSVSGRGRTSSSSSPGNGLSKWYVITSQMTWLVPAAVFLLAIIIIVFGGNDDPTPAAP